MVVPKAIGEGGEVTQATYDKITISTGRIYTPYYATIVNEGDPMTSEALLITNVMDSCYQALNYPASIGLLTDSDYDLEFIRPRRIGGNCVISITYGVFCSIGASVTVGGYAKLSLYRVNADGVETQLGDKIQLGLCKSTNLDTGEGLWYRRTAKIVIPVTKFRVGDIFRLSVEIWGTTETANTYVSYLTDPSGRTYASYNNTAATTLIVQTPFIPDF
jgi:hypothetical protein